ncbi:MAG: dephospho-CoA kinase [Acidobacteria bacterium]|nr:dephospho-CoA kinase [Acidobacteriota bacterium]
MRAALTGGIASGKSTVALAMSGFGARIVDADAVAHAVLETQGVGESIFAAFGEGVRTADGTVDRAALGRLIFASPDARRTLDRLTHPPILETLERRVADAEALSPDTLVVTDVPLLYEVCRPGQFGPVVVAWCRPEVQLRRLMSRDGFDEADARRRIEAQMPLEEKRSRADFVVDTSGSIAETREQVRDLFPRLVAFCRGDARVP